MTDPWINGRPVLVADYQHRAVVKRLGVMLAEELSGLRPDFAYYAIEDTDGTLWSGEAIIPELIRQFFLI